MTSSLAIVEIRAWAGGVEAPLKRQCALGERSEIYRQMVESRAETEWHLAGRRGTRAMREAHGQTEPLREMLTRGWTHPVTITAVNATNQ